MAFSRARWACVDHLHDVMGAEPRSIDGGYEYNGAYVADLYVAETGLPYEEWAQRPGWWVLDNTYAVSILPRDGYVERHREGYFSWLGMTTRHVMVLEREGEPAPI